ncbi:MAG: hypothetical protein KGM47_00265 [Acidobacteriota bacterium]|nr:hypothetical protein [Acidobacteriota bacterium]
MGRKEKREPVAQDWGRGTGVPPVGIMGKMAMPRPGLRSSRPWEDMGKMPMPRPMKLLRRPATPGDPQAQGCTTVSHSDQRKAF